MYGCWIWSEWHEIVVMVATAPQALLLGQGIKNRCSSDLRCSKTQAQVTPALTWVLRLARVPENSALGWGQLRHQGLRKSGAVDGMGGGRRTFVKQRDDLVVAADRQLASIVVAVGSLLVGPLDAFTGGQALG
jgi:hypothetical protein